MSSASQVMIFAVNTTIAKVNFSALSSVIKIGSSMVVFSCSQHRDGARKHTPPFARRFVRSQLQEGSI
jgi:hypothetical protein